jgi:hypothetical protein
MKRLKGRRPSPSLAISLVALFVALGGVSYAAATIGSAQIKNNSVKGTDIKNGSIASKDISKKTRNSLKGQRGPAGPKGAAGAAGAAAANVYAVVTDAAGAANSSLVRGKGVVSVSEATGTLVRFDRDVSNCVWVANKNEPGTGVAVAGFAQVSLSPTGNDTLDVRTRTEAGGITDAPFHVAVLC